MASCEIKRALDLVSEAKRRIENLTVKQLGEELEGGEVVLVDLREQNERELHGVIAGAVHAPRGMPEFWADPTRRCTGRNPTRSAGSCCTVPRGRFTPAAETLKQMGYGNAAHLDAPSKPGRRRPLGEFRARERRFAWYAQSPRRRCPHQSNLCWPRQRRC